MNIAFYAPMKAPDDPTPSGDRRMARLLLDALGRGGARVRLVSRLRTYDAGDPARQRRLMALGARLAARLARRLEALPAAERPALWFTYHLYHKAPDPLGPPVAAALGIPYVLAEASHAPKRAGGAWDVGLRVAEGAIRAADRIFCLNPSDAACLAPLVKDASVLADLPPFLDIAAFAADADGRAAARAAIAARFALPPGEPLILTVAMMRADQKLASYGVLAEALARLSATGPWRLLVVGAGPAAAAVRTLMAPFGGRVVFAGLEEGAGLRTAYAAADLFVWPAVKEAMGLAFLEAAAAGLPVVAGRSGAIAHIVEDGLTGLVVPAGDAGATAAALGALLADPARRRAMGERAAARALAVNDVAVAARFLARDLGNLIPPARPGGSDPFGGGGAA